MKLPYRELPGLNAKLLKDHYKLYEGYQKRWEANHKQLTAERWTGRDLSVQSYGRLVAEQGFLENAIALHELYFMNLAPGGRGEPTSVLPAEEVDAILSDMSYLALSSTGWVILGVSIPRGPFEIITMSDHGTGFTARFWPLLVLDCYEHAYMPQYGVDKEAYLQAFWENVDWEEVRRRGDVALAFKEAVPVS